MSKISSRFKKIFDLARNKSRKLSLDKKVFTLSNFRKKPDSSKKVDSSFSLFNLLSHVKKFKLAAVFIVGLCLAHIFWLAITAFLLEPPAPGKVKSGLNIKTVYRDSFVESSDKYSDITSINAFCRGCPVPDIKSRMQDRPKDCDDAKPTRGITLIGTIVMSDAQHSVAIIKSGSDESKAVKIGDEISRSGIIFEIQRNKICLEKDDSTLSYVLLKDLDVEPPSSNAAQTGSPSPSPVMNSGNSNDGIKIVNEGLIELDKEKLVSALSDFNILQQAEAVTITGPNGLEGFEIRSIQPGSILNKLVRPGDRIKGINGQPIRDFSQIQSLASDVNNLSELKLNIERNGQDQAVTYKTK